MTRAIALTLTAAILASAAASPASAQWRDRGYYGGYPGYHGGYHHHGYGWGPGAALGLGLGLGAVGGALLYSRPPSASGKTNISVAAVKEGRQSTVYGENRESAPLGSTNAVEREP
jgi:opacity protein-like surface antigen